MNDKNFYRIISITAIVVGISSIIISIMSLLK